MTLVEFYLARLAEVEQWALAAQDGDGYAEWDNPSTGVVQVAGGGMDGLVTAPRNAAVHIALHDPASVLRDVESKRRILHNLAAHAERDEGPTAIISPESRALISHTRWHLRMLALPYADHPEYNESWRP